MSNAQFALLMLAIWQVPTVTRKRQTQISILWLVIAIVFTAVEIFK